MYHTAIDIFDGLAAGGFADLRVSPALGLRAGTVLRNPGRVGGAGAVRTLTSRLEGATVGLKLRPQTPTASPRDGHCADQCLP